MSFPSLSIDRECFNGSEAVCAVLGPTLPKAIRAYIAHIHGQAGIRAIARARGCPASTVSRQVRRIEARRDDPLVDAALRDLGAAASVRLQDVQNQEGWIAMAAMTAKIPDDLEARVKKEARRILRRLCEKDAFLAIAEDMEKGVVLREGVPGKHTRTAVVDRDVAHQFALHDWINVAKAGRIARYEITDAGRSALKRLLEQDRAERQANGCAEAPSPFRAQHQSFGEREVASDGGGGPTRVRYNLAESPLTVLGRKRDRAGIPYLSPELIEAGERLREDFELAQMGPRVTQNWDNFLSAGDAPAAGSGRGPAEGPTAARARVQAAMTALGPGLSDVVFRVCCFLEGLETAEKRLGWSARSGKVVLRIALERLALHYGLRARVPRDTKLAV